MRVACAPRPSELEGGVQQLQRELSGTAGADGGRAALAELDESVGALRHVGEGVSELQGPQGVHARAHAHARTYARRCRDTRRCTRATLMHALGYARRHMGTWEKN